MRVVARELIVSANKARATFFPLRCPVALSVSPRIQLKSGKVDVGFDCETGSLIKDVKVGDQLTVEYKEAGGKKIATKVTPKNKKAACGY